MTENENTSKKSVWIVSGIIGIVAIVAIVLILRVASSGKVAMVTPLYHYYPKNATFYAEVAPSPKLEDALLNRIDTLRASKTNATDIDKLKVESIFEKDFQNQLSVGSWPSPAPAPKQPAPPPKGTAPAQSKPVTTTPTNEISNMVVIIPTKPTVTMDNLIADMKVPMDKFHKVVKGDVTLLVGNNPYDSTLALYNHQVIIATNEAALMQAIAQSKATDSIIDNPLVHPALGALPSKREGTFIALTNAVEKQAPAVAGFEKIQQVRQQLQAATPVLVGSITTENDTYIRVNTITPIHLENIKDATLSKDINEIFSKNVAFEQPNLLPDNTSVLIGATELGSYYDLFVQHMASEQDKARIDALTNQTKSLGLDFRKNIVGLVDGQAASGILATGNQSPEILLFLNRNEATEKTLEQISTLAASILHGTLSEDPLSGNTHGKIFESPRFPIQIGFSNITGNQIILGTKPGVDTVYAVQQKKQSTLAQSALFQGLMQSMPAQMSNIYFVNLPKAMPLIESLRKKNASSETETMLKILNDSVEGFGGYNLFEGNQEIRGYFAVKLTPSVAQSHP